MWKGSLHHAVCFQKGPLEIADQGTFFFDEIATIKPKRSQASAVIQEREFMRLGGTEQLKVDVAHRSRFQRRPPHSGFARAASAKIVSPPERDPPPDPRCATRAKMSPSAGAFPGALLPGKLEAPPAIHAGGHEALDGLRLAGKNVRDSKTSSSARWCSPRGAC